MVGMAGNPDEWTEVYDPGAFDEQLPASLPVRGPVGEIIEGASAEVSKDAGGLAVSVTMPAARVGERDGTG
jgi:hypothetical protein